MKKVTEEITVFSYNELDEQVRTKVREDLHDLAISNDWYSTVVEDFNAVYKALGFDLELEAFDLDRNTLILEGSYESPNDLDAAIEKVLAYRPDREKLCKKLQALQLSYGNAIKASFENDPFLETTRVKVTSLKFRCKEDAEIFTEIIGEVITDYRCLLRECYGDLTSDENIEEIIRINEYEFFADGTLYAPRGTVVKEEHLG